MKFCCKTETFMLQINGNLTVSIEHLIINNKTGLAKKILTEIKKKQFPLLMVCTISSTSYVIWRHCISLYPSSNIAAKKVKGENNFREKQNTKYF